MWPGFGDNSRVLKWVLERVAGTGDAAATAIGNVPTASAIDTTGLDLDDETMAALLAVDEREWAAEVDSIREFYASIGERLPDALSAQLDALADRLGVSV